LRILPFLLLNSCRALAYWQFPARNIGQFPGLAEEKWRQAARLGVQMAEAGDGPRPAGIEGLGLNSMGGALQARSIWESEMGWSRLQEVINMQGKGKSDFGK